MMLTYSAPATAQPQAYYQVGGVQQVAGMQPQPAFSTMAQTATAQPAFEQSFAVAAPQPLMEQQQMATVPATTAPVEPALAVQPEMIATTTQATAVFSKKTKKKMSSKKKEKACC